MSVSHPNDSGNSGGDVDVMMTIQDGYFVDHLFNQNEHEHGLLSTQTYEYTMIDNGDSMRDSSVNLKIQERSRRMDKIAKYILGYCMDKYMIYHQTHPIYLYLSASHLALLSIEV